MQSAEEDFLVLAAQQGSQKAFRTLFQRIPQPALVIALKVCRDADMAQDTVQDAWIKLARNLGNSKDPRGFRSFLFQTVHWRCIDLLRRKHRLAE